MTLETAKGLGGFILFITILISISRILYRKERYLKKNGIRGFAKIVGIEKTIYEVNKQRIYKISLEIDSPGMPPEIITIKKGFDRFTRNTLPELDAIVPTLTDPKNPKVVVIDYTYWSRR